MNTLTLDEALTLDDDEIEDHCLFGGSVDLSAEQVEGACGRWLHLSGVAPDAPEAEAWRREVTGDVPLAAVLCAPAAVLVAWFARQNPANWARGAGTVEGERRADVHLWHSESMGRLRRAAQLMGTAVLRWPLVVPIA